MTRARNSANLASHGNLFVDITNDRTGIGSIVPAQNLHVAGTAGFHADVTLTGDLYNSTWDRSDNSLKFVDNAKIKLGTSNDLQIYHDGSFSRFQNGSSGDILIKNSASGRVLYLQSAIIQMQPPGGGDVIFDGRADGDVKLYYDGSQKFQTTAYGTNTTGTAVNDGLVVAGVATVTTMNVTGVLTYDDVTSVDSVGIVTAREGVIIPDNKALSLGNRVVGSTAGDLRLYHDGSNSYIDEIGSGNLYIRNASDTAIFCQTDGTVKLHYDGSEKLATSSTGVSITGAIASSGNLSISNVAPKIFLTDSDSDSDFAIRNMHGVFGIHDSTNSANRLTINSSGNATFSGDLTVSGNLSVTGTTSQNNSVSTAQKTITLASGAANNAAVDGAGIVIDAGSDTDKTLKWLDNTDRWTFTGGDVAANAFYGDGSNLTGIDTDLVSDTSPQLGGGLASNGFNINFADSSGTNNMAKFGASGDLQIYHDSAHSRIVDTGTGDLKLQTSKLTIGNVGNTETMASFTADGAVKIYYDNSEKLETRPTGLRMQNSSTFDVNGGLIKFGNCSSAGSDDTLMFGGNGDDLKIFHGGNSQFDNNTGHIEIRNIGDFSSTREIRIRARVDENCINAYSDGAVKLYYDNGLQFETLTNGVKPTNNLFMNDNKPIYIGNGLDLQLYHDGTNSYIKNATGGLRLSVAGGSNQVQINKGTVDENMAKFIADGAVELYHNNIKTLETLNEGIKVHTGSTSTVIRISSNTDVESIIQGYNSDLLIKSPSSGNITLYANGTESAVNCIANGAVELFHNGNRQCFTFDGGMNWQDTKKAEFGNSGDLKIYHNGSNSAVQNYQGALYISNKETNSSDLHLQGKDSIQMHCPSDGTVVQKIDNNRLTTFDVGAPSSSNKTIARFQSESSRKLDVVWHDSGSYMGFDTPGNHPYMFKVNGTSAMEINTYREAKVEASTLGWSTLEMRGQGSSGTRFHYRLVSTGSSGATINLIRVRRHYWGSGWYHIKMRQSYYNGSAEGHWWLHGHGRSTGSYSPSWQLNHTNHNNLGGGKVKITSNSTSSPGNDYSGYTDVYADIGSYEHYEVVVETSCLNAYSHDVTSIANDGYALHAV